MQYRSTRGGASGVTFEHALFDGLARDGGLYIPHRIPRLSLGDIAALQSLPFPKLALAIFRPFIDPSEIPDADLLSILERSFATFDSPTVAPLVDLPGSAEGFSVLELWHGPTFAFKDVALQVVGNLFEYFLKRRNGEAKKAANGTANGHGEEHTITVLGATSGDTGSAAIYGLRGKDSIKVFILHPKGRVSPVQEAQMTTVLDDNVFNVAVEGTFDDCQEVVKACFNDQEFREKHRLAAVNSINWARILSQITYYFAAYFQHVAKRGLTLDPSAPAESAPKVSFSVPTGNFGDILAGYYATRMGLPVDRLLVATNRNDILHRFLQTGDYSKRRDPATGKVLDAYATASPAMDILVSSNFERLCWYLERGDGRGADMSAGSVAQESDPASAESRASVAVRGHMVSLSSKGSFSVTSSVLDLSRSLFDSDMVDDVETADCIHRYYSRGGYILDPHTAVGVVAAERAATRDAAVWGTHNGIVLATAHPGKFPDAVLKSLRRGGKEVAYSDIATKEMLALEGMPRRCTEVQTDGGDKAKALNGVKKVIGDVVAGVDVFTQ
ncbi:tryptophan synthase beta subunit-like PLP-dependent enzyme [Gonapodya prolifera JEL478]|uniref:Tryptophan synthase beta subunit-like PLP-dependent enzyme n=1 Tax=Gonapodya prolifera (strain JEL478) TaxID=1344416 RepID=A0A139A5F1_GONPJ|nr:tryptophan synthase beta subunit-like PLP-dependent enzyme [Gonapodya prolifera JEL478]|eukprot:KXS12020.1 tryptophan synthase beta subunit-like PLP-dependent enzyme [Gonapodya prolifera JEL478]